MCMAKKQTPQAKDKKLSLQQERFCILYSSDREFFGNGVQSYIEAYEINVKQPGAYNSAKSSAFELLTKPYILERINELLEARGLNDAFVDKQLEFLITQNASFDAKIRAIAEYNSLRKRITKKVELAGEDGQPLTVTVVNYGNPPAAQLRPAPVPGAPA